jgi:uncharacterized repeat protein (TIGR01451 family)
MTRLNSTIRSGVGLIVMFAVVATLILPTTATQAVELPPINSPIFIQTNGPDADIGLGDWYSSSQNGIGGGYHYLTVNVPCGWPDSLDIHIDLYSPEINNFDGPISIDEIRGGLNNTTFELYNQNTPMNLPREPAPGAPGSLIQRTFTPVTTQPEQWTRFYTMTAPTACGIYVLRSETHGNDQNSWRLRIGHDTNADPNDSVPPGYDNPDRLIGTGDELTVGIVQTTYQHDVVGQVVCLLHYQFVKANLPEVRFHNFDLDNNERVTYYPPSAVFDPTGAVTPGSVPGTVSGFTRWNGGTQTSRGTGDVVLDPEPGWWRMVTCVRDDNQFNQEGQTGVPLFREPVPEPDMSVRKDDGRTLVAPGDVLTYTIRFTNQALSTKVMPGAAFNVTLTDRLPPNLSFRGCRLATPGLRGSCAQQGQDVVFTLTDRVAAGVSGELQVTAAVNPGASGQVLNMVALDYADSLNNPYPRVTSEDLDLIPGAAPRPQLIVEKTARLAPDRNGNGRADPAELIEYTIVVSNTGAVAATNVQLRDTPDANTTLVTGTVSLDPSGGVVLQGNRFGDRSIDVTVGMIAPKSSARVRFMVRVNDQLPAGVSVISNQAIVRGTDVPDTPSDDPSTPEPGDPTDVPTRTPPGGGPPTPIDLLDFRAATAGSDVFVRWSTGVEVGTFGYIIVRATSAERAAAVAVSELIPARGHGGGGADYLYVDRTATPGVTYHYWLVEVELGGVQNDYGPAALRVGASAADEANPIYLPMLIR